MPSVVGPTVVRAGVLVLAVSALLWATRRDEPRILVRFIRSSDADFVDRYVERFNDLSLTARGKTIEVVVVAQSSGDTETALCELATETGCEKPAIWMPASTAWLELAGLGEGGSEPEIVEHVVLSPQVLAVWQAPDGSIDPRLPVHAANTIELTEVLESAAGPQGAGLRIAHTDPTSSTSGLHAAVAVYAAAGGHTEPDDLPEIAADAEREPVEARASAFEELVTGYCGTADDLLDRALGAEDPTAIFDVAYIQETSLVQRNAELDDDDPSTAPPLRALYPTDAPYVADYPIAVLDPEPWVRQDPTLREAATTFVQWFIENLDPDDHLKQGFRTSDGTGGGLVQADHGALEQLPTVLADPLRGEHDLTTIQDAWSRVRRPVRLALVVDASGAMGRDLRWRALALEVHRSLVPDIGDRIGIWALHDGQVDALPQTGDAIDRVIEALEPSGEAPLWDGMVDASRWLAEEEGTPIEALIVLTSGTDAGSENGQFDVAPLLGTGERPAIPVLVVPFGTPPDARVLGPLQQLAHDTNGRVLDAAEDVQVLASDLAKAC